MITLTVVFDNYDFNPDLQTEWGFSCYVDGLEEPLLFDTGSDGTILLNNMGMLGIDPKKIHRLLISHDHWDHTGGLERLLAENNDVEVYMLASFSQKTKDIADNNGAKLTEINAMKELMPHVYTTGTLGESIKEQALVIETAQGLVIVTGCAHPGIDNMIHYVKETFEQPLYVVIGGFHLGQASDTKLRTIIAQLRKDGVHKVGPSHCSGERCRELFQQEYDNDFIEVGVGMTITVE